ncbi:acyl-CoA dehydrogenase family protein [Pseudonocardia sp. WMMC193]|uniref:acyl-CoA dehydrogenase family protein n=1 Tax=Pseudonocardia sp. WMMC193 TaxID=2911965 RepID=UPI001F18635C|nr:acyl-CoA dehydrogenase family protein [Pseudonocardia sp. WMMC193]MCF7550518.1 acyl-CoA dehydrogenase family protein [Pseudonocardia sp. WMMC193]
MTDLSTYREELRAWLRAHAPAPGPATDVAAAKAFQAALFDAGYAGITWPTDVGGQGLGPEYQQVFSDESSEYELPTGVFTIGQGMCGPTVNDLGTTEQRTRYLPPLLRGEEIWCQLFSEPGAGSDVASLQTRAVPADDGWVVDGQKVWTTGAQWSDYGALLARTDPDRPKHSGLTMFIIDMHAPGVTVRPLKDMSGRSPFNEITFDSVHLPADSVIGEVNAGWHAAVTMLGHERVTIGSRRTAKTNPLDFAAVRALARDLGVDADPAVRDRLAELYTRERVLELFNARVRQETAAGNAPGARGSVGKLAGALLSRLAVEVVGEIAGPAAAGWEADDERGAGLALGITSSPAAGIAGGTNEIQRGIIGERILGLPKEPSVDRGVPFRELRVGTQR